MTDNATAEDIARTLIEFRDFLSKPNIAKYMVVALNEAEARGERRGLLSALNEAILVQNTLITAEKINSGSISERYGFEALGAEQVVSAIRALLEEAE